MRDTAQSWLSKLYHKPRIGIRATGDLSQVIIDLTIIHSILSNIYTDTGMMLIGTLRSTRGSRTIMPTALILLCCLLIPLTGEYSFLFHGSEIW